MARDFVVPFSVLDLSPIRRRDGRRVVPQHSRPRPARRAAGLPPLLAGRAPRHPRHRQRRDRRRHRPRRRRHVARSASAPAASCCPTTRRWSIAEQFGTLESLFPGRIDLGLGRAPGGDPRTARALRRQPRRRGDTFPQDLAELMAYFRPGGPGNGVHAVPGEGLDVPIWLLGSSDFAARLAAELGPAVRLRVPLRPGLPARGAGPLPAVLQPSERACSTPARDGRRRTCSRPTPTRRPQDCSRRPAGVPEPRAGSRRALPPPVESMEGCGSGTSGRTSSG